MTEVRQRAVADSGISKENLDSAGNTVGENLVHTASITKEIKNELPEEKKKVGAGDDDDDGEEMIVVPDFAAAESMHKGSDLTSDVIDATLKDVSPRWRNWIIRGIFTWVMIFAFGGVIYLGPLCIVLLLLHIVFRWRNWIVRTVFTMMMITSFSFVVYLGSVALVLLRLKEFIQMIFKVMDEYLLYMKTKRFWILIIQIKCFHEIITIGYVVYRSHNLPWFRTLSWFFLFASNYFFYGESIIQYFGVFMSRTEFLNLLVVYHRFISFSLYVAALCGFVMSLVKKNYLKQFIMFGWTHVTLLIIVTQSHLFMQNVFEGIIWFLVPVSMIICNDIMAYIFGFFFGRTPLIKLSPKKTWEGFIGGAISTVVFGVVISYILVQFDFFVCPVEYDEAKGALSTECIRTPEFRPTDFALPMFIQKIGSLFGQNLKTVKMYPFVLHSVSLSVFASVIGPFGGFFASGFKRAFRIKDFGDTIPGHGGFMDRFDCQCLMATFVHVYHSSFIKLVSPQKLVQQITALKPEQQLQVFTMLQEVLLKRGLIDSTTQLPIELPLVNE